MKDVDYNPMYQPNYAPPVVTYGSTTVNEGDIVGQADAGSRSPLGAYYGSGLPEVSGGEMYGSAGSLLGGSLAAILIGGLVVMTIPWIIMYFVTRAACKSAMKRK